MPYLIGRLANFTMTFGDGLGFPAALHEVLLHVCLDASLGLIESDLLLDDIRCNLVECPFVITPFMDKCRSSLWYCCLGIRSTVEEMRIMTFVAFVSISTFAMGPMPTWFVNLLGLVRWRLTSRSSWLFTFRVLARIKHLLVMTVFTIFAFSACFLDEMEMTWDLLLGSWTSTSAIWLSISFPFSFSFCMLFWLRWW